MLNKKKVVVIGGGPAGMIAAARAAELGAQTILMEKTDSLGNKLLITGKDRCNVTNISGIKEFVLQFGKKGNFLYPAFQGFFNEDLIRFFEKLGVKTKVERGGRVFPKSDKSEDILRALVRHLKNTGVKTIFDTAVRSVITRNKKICSVKTDNEKEYLSVDSVILCTGGLSYPGTGSTGEGYRIAEKLGHKIVSTRPALVPLETKESWPREISGLTLENINVTAECNGKKICEEFGDMLFAHFGISGPIVLKMSKIIGQYLEKGKVFISIDLKPALSHDKLDLRLQRDFIKYSNKAFKNSLDDLLPQSLIPVIVRLSVIPADKPVHSITRQERMGLVNLFKCVKLEIPKTLPIEVAIITSGGVAIEEVDNHTMGSKIIKELYFAGEILDLDAPTGGYNLQMAFSTGWLAGESASKNSQQSTVNSPQ